MKDNYLGTLIMNKTKAGKVYFKGKFGEEKVIGWIDTTKKDGTPIVNSVTGEQLTLLSIYKDEGKADDAGKVNTITAKTKETATKAENKGTIKGKTTSEDAPF